LAADRSNGGGFGRRFCFRRTGRRNCSPYWRTVAAAGFNRMPTAPRSSMKMHSAAIRLTTSSGVNIDAIISPGGMIPEAIVLIADLLTLAGRRGVPAGGLLGMVRLSDLGISRRY
jgi:hypothetical protein